MRQIFAVALAAVALAAGVLLLGGCDRQHAASSGPAAVGGVPAATHGTAATIGKPTPTRAGATTNATQDVTSLLGDVDKQLDSDSQPTKDSD